MNSTLMAMLGWPETIAILVVVLVLFGAKKLPELARGLGQGLKEFKKATRDVQEDLQRAIEEETPANTSRRVPEKAPEVAAVDVKPAAAEAAPRTSPEA